jgi:hypothetical protein
MNFDFDKDLVDGHKAEDIVLAKIQKKYPKAYRIKGYFKGCDIIVPEVEIKVEVKYDILSKKFNHYFIETKSGGEPSGIMTTDAKQWVVYDGEGLLWIATESLRYLMQGKSEREYPAKGKDKSRSGVLLDRDELQRSPYSKYVIVK